MRQKTRVRISHGTLCKGYDTAKLALNALDKVDNNSRGFAPAAAGLLSVKDEKRLIFSKPKQIAP
jgi:hypothetical protein